MRYMALLFIVLVGCSGEGLISYPDQVNDKDQNNPEQTVVVEDPSPCPPPIKISVIEEGQEVVKLLIETPCAAPLESHSKMSDPAGWDNENYINHEAPMPVIISNPIKGPR